jgi:hypothetical protein
LIPLVASPYELEDHLEGFLDAEPQLIPGALVDPGAPRRWLRIYRQVPVPDRPGGGEQWTLDNLFCDQDGVLTLVEVKRSSDTRARREVVAQMLDYAANGTAFWTRAELEVMFRTHAERRGDDVDAELRSFLGSDDEDAFWQSVETNLRAGRVRLVFVADRIAPELRRIVEFLNEHMPDVDVLAVEVRQYLDQDRNTVLVPHVIGRTATAEDQKARSARTSRRSFDEEWATADDAALHARRLLDDWAAGDDIVTRADKHLLRYVLGSTKMLYLDPTGWIGFTRLAGLKSIDEAATTQIFEALADVAPSTTGQLYPVIDAGTVVSAWEALEARVLHPYLALVRLHG